MIFKLICKNSLNSDDDDDDDENIHIISINSEPDKPR